MHASSTCDIEQLQQELCDLKQEYQDYAYVVSHDLSAPLRTIEGFAALLIDEQCNVDDEKISSYLQHIISGVDESKRVLAALLEYSRLNSRAQVLTACDCNAVVVKAQAALSELMRTSQAIFHCDPLPVIVADVQQIQLLFYHLIKNALVYCKADIRPQIHIHAQELPRAWRFSITDNGIGIKANVKDKIFIVLRRGVSKKQYPGIGMGLAIAKKIVGRHGGSLTLDSVPNEGATFCFTIAKGLAHD